MPAREGPVNAADLGSSHRRAVAQGFVRADFVQLLPRRTGVVDRYDGPELHGGGAGPEQPEALPAAPLTRLQVPSLPHKTLEYKWSAPVVPAGVRETPEALRGWR